jgi:hypothetical protein
VKKEKLPRSKRGFLFAKGSRKQVNGSLYRPAESADLRDRIGWGQWLAEGDYRQPVLSR